MLFCWHNLEFFKITLLRKQGIEKNHMMDRFAAETMQRNQFGQARPTEGSQAGLFLAVASLLANVLKLFSEDLDWLVLLGC